MAESNYTVFFTVGGEPNISNTKTIKYDAVLSFDFDAAPKVE